MQNLADLPPLLEAKDLVKLLGRSKPTVNRLLQDCAATGEPFQARLIRNKYVVSRDAFIRYLEGGEMGA